MWCGIIYNNDRDVIRGVIYSYVKGKSMKEEKRSDIAVYIAGPITATTPLQYLENIRVGLAYKNIILKLGYTVFCPMEDFVSILAQDGCLVGVETLQRNSLEMLKRCDVIFLCPGWEKSEGVKKELKVARKLGIKVVTIKQLTNWECEPRLLLWARPVRVKKRKVKGEEVSKRNGRC